MITSSTDAIAALDTPTLRRELAKALTITAEHLAYLAAIWRELEQRGEDLSELRSGIAVYLPLIAAGQLDAEAVVKFAGQKTLLRAIATLPVDEQRRLARGGSVSMVTVDSSGKYVEREIPASALTAAQTRLVFDVARVRTVQEQELLLESDRMRSQRAARRHAVGQITVDQKGRTLRVGRTRLTVADVLGALAHLHSEDAEAPSDDSKPVPISLTPQQHRALKVRAAETDQSMGSLVRSVLAAAGLFD